jgi:hypothetical protein
VKVQLGQRRVPKFARLVAQVELATFLVKTILQLSTKNAKIAVDNSFVARGQ